MGAMCQVNMPGGRTMSAGTCVQGGMREARPGGQHMAPRVWLPTNPWRLYSENVLIVSSDANVVDSTCSLRPCHPRLPPLLLQPVR